MPNPVIHFEIGCRNSEKMQQFYSGLFDWTFQAGGPAAMANTGSKEGIQGHLMSLGHEPHNYCVVYVQVDDLQKYLDKATKLGGKTLIPPQEVPNMGHFAWFTDPEGTMVGLWKPMAR